MDTSPLEEKIKAIEAEIADDYQRIKDVDKEAARKIALIKDNIITSKRALKVYKKGLERIKGQEKMKRFIKWLKSLHFCYYYTYAFRDCRDSPRHAQSAVISHIKTNGGAGIGSARKKIVRMPLLTVERTNALNNQSTGEKGLNADKDR